jgi:hypothetical protein
MDDFFNFDSLDSEEIIKRILREHSLPLKKIINDTEPKEIGDRVVVLDYSSVSHIDGEELDDNDYDNIDTMEDGYYIVIETKTRIPFKNYIQDTIIVNPKTNEKFRAVSRHLKIYRRF